MEDGAFVIVNPAAGGGRCGKHASRFLAQLKTWRPFTVYETHGAGEATRAARTALAQGWRRFLAIGGDGTAFEVINGLAEAIERGEHVCVGLVPLGTGNSFLRDFGVEEPQQVLEALKAERLHPVDLVRLDHEKGSLYSINIISLGFVADVNALRQKQLRRLGEAGYVLSVLINVARMKAGNFELQAADGRYWSGRYLFVSINNSRFTGGRMMMAPRASVNDGKADLILVKPMSRLRLVRCFPKIFAGKHLEMPEVSYEQVRKLEFCRGQEQEVMVDGEALRLAPKGIEVVPGAIEVYA